MLSIEEDDREMRVAHLLLGREVRKEDAAHRSVTFLSGNGCVCSFWLKTTEWQKKSYLSQN